MSTPNLNRRFEIKGPTAAQISAAFEREYAKGLETMRAEIERVWTEKAQQALNTTYMAYDAGLSFKTESDGVSVMVKGWLPVALETGAPSFDMKPGLLKNRQSRVIPMHDGEFRTVSKNSPPQSWIHPGFEGKGIHEQVEQEAEAIITKAFQGAFDRINV